MAMTTAPRCERCGRRARRVGGDGDVAHVGPQESLGRVQPTLPWSDEAGMNPSHWSRRRTIGHVMSRAPHFRRSTPSSSARCSGTSPPASRSSPAWADDEPAGFTIGSFTSVSLDPPLVGFLPQIASETWQAMAPDGRFCVNVLRDEQAELCWRFAKTGVGDDRFDDVDVVGMSPTGCPIIEGIGAWIDCTVEQSIDARRPLLRRRQGGRPVAQRPSRTTRSSSTRAPSAASPATDAE